MAGPCEHSNKPFDSIKCNFLQAVSYSSQKISPFHSDIVNNTQLHTKVLCNSFNVGKKNAQTQQRKTVQKPCFEQRNTPFVDCSSLVQISSADFLSKIHYHSTKKTCHHIIIITDNLLTIICCSIKQIYKRSITLLPSNIKNMAIAMTPTCSHFKVISTKELFSTFGGSVKL